QPADDDRATGGAPDDLLSRIVVDRSVGGKEHIVLQAADARVPLDDVRQRGALELLQLPAGKAVLVPEAVAVPQPLELVDDHRREQLAQTGSGKVVFGQPADPDVDIVDAPVE